MLDQSLGTLGECFWQAFRFRKRQANVGGKREESHPLAERLLALAPLTDISEYEDRSGHPAGGVTNGRGTVVDWAFRTVARSQDGVVGQPDDDFFAQGAFSRIGDGRARLLVINP